MTAVFIKEVAGEIVELSLDNLQVFEQVAVPGETYNLVDAATGLTPQDVTATRLLDDLVLNSESLDLEVRIKDFWANCQPGDDQCFVALDVPAADGSMGKTLVTQSDHELEFLLAGETGTLVEEIAIAPWLIGLAALVAAAAAGGSKTDNKDTTAPSKPTVEIEDGGDGYLNADEVEEGVIVKVTPPTDAAVGDTLDVDTDGDGEPDFTKELTADDIKEGVAVTVPAEDIKDGETLTVTATVTDPAGNTSPKGEDSSKVDISKPNGGEAPIVTLTDDYLAGETPSETGDGYINKTEWENDGNDLVDVRVSFDGEKVEVGDTVVITDNTDPSNPTVKSIEITADDKGNGYVTTTFEKPAEGSNIVVDAIIKDTAGNQTEKGEDTAKLDTSDLDGVAITIVDDANNDGKISQEELGEDGKITVSVKLPENAIAGDILVITGTDSADVNIVLTEADIKATTVSYNFNAIDNGQEFVTTAQVTDPAGNQSNVAEDKAMMQLQSPDAPTVVIDEDADNDGYINAEELDGDIDVTITVPEGTEIGSTLTIEDNAGNTRTVTVTQEVLDEGAKETFPAPAEGEKITVTAVVTDPAGNPSSKGSDSATLDTSDLTTGLAITITEDEDNDGFISIDEFKDNDIDVKVTLPEEASVGDTLTVEGNGTKKTIILTEEQVAAKSVELSYDAPADGAEFVATATIKDVAGNVGGPVQDRAVMQLSKPGVPIVNIAEDENNDGFINGEELEGDIDISVTLPGTAKAGDTLNLDTNDDGIPDQTKVLELSDIQSGNVSFTTPVPSPQEGATVTAEAWVTDAAGNEGEKGSDEAVIDTIPPNSTTTKLVIDDVTADNLIEADEAAETIPVTGTVTNEFKEGDIVTLTINGKDFTGAVDADGKFSITVPGADLAADPDTTIDAKVAATDEAGNVGDVPATKVYEVKLNVAPVGVNDDADVVEDIVAKGNVLDNDTDENNDTLTVTGYTIDANGDGSEQEFAAGETATIAKADGTAIGELVINADGTYTFTPATDYYGEAPNATYTVSDGELTDTAQLLLDGIKPASDTPAPVDDVAKTDEDTPVTIDVLANDTDADGDELTITHVDGQEIDASTPVTLTDDSNNPIATVELVDGKLKVTPAENYNGTTEFSYTVTDGETPVDAKVTLTVNPVNDAPVAQNDKLTTPEDTAVTVNVLNNDSDVDGDDLTITQVDGNDIAEGETVTLADGATVTLTDGKLAVTPVNNNTDDIIFDYTISDGNGGTDTATVTVDVGGVNDVPVANADVNNTNEDTSLNVDAASGVLSNDTDEDGDVLAVSAVEYNGGAGTVGDVIAGAWGNLTLNSDGSYTYSPNDAAQALDDGESEQDVFTYTATDPSGSTATATLTVTVEGKNDAPVTTDDTAQTTFNVPVTIDVLANDSDQDGDTLTITQINSTDVSEGDSVDVKDAADNVIGTATLTGGEIVFTPASGYQGGADFTYTVSDGTDSTEANVNVTVGENQAPNAVEDVVSVDEDNTVNFDLRANDTDPDGDNNALVVSQINGSDVSAGDEITLTEGVLRMKDDGTFDFTPNENFNGEVNFTYQVTDAFGATADTTAKIIVNAINDAPVGVDDDANVIEDIVATGNVLDNDTDADTAHDDLVVTGYTIDANGDGSEQAFAVGETATIAKADGTAIGELVINADGSYTFTPATDYNGAAPDATYTVSDGELTDTAQLLLDGIEPASDTPAPVDDVAKTDEDTPVTIDVLANDTDADGDELTITHVDGQEIDASTPVTLTDASNNPIATVALVDGKLVVTPAENYNGTIEFPYTVTDGETPVDANVTLTVNPVNDAPVAQDDKVTTAEDTAVTVKVLSNDSDVDGDDLTITQVDGTDITDNETVTLASGATVQLVGGELVVTPVANSTDDITFDYTISDGNGGTDTATVTVDVGGVNDVPVANADVNNTNEDTSLNVDAASGVLSNDTDEDGDVLAVSAVEYNGTAGTVGDVIAGAWGNLTLNSDGSYTYSPNDAAQALDDGESEQDVFTYTATDPSGETATATLTVTVEGKNDAPVTTDDTEQTTFNVPVTIDVLDNDSDPDGDTLTITQINSTDVSEGDSVDVKDAADNVIGTATLTGGEIVFTPADGYEGGADFTYTVSDGTDSTEANVNVTVGENQAPNAVEDVVTVDTGNTVNFDLRANDSDPDGDNNALVITQINGADVSAGDEITLSEGVLRMKDDGTFDFTPNDDYDGEVNFTYQVRDAFGATADSTGKVIVTDVIPPVIDIQTIAGDSQNPIDVDADNYAVIGSEPITIGGTSDAGENQTVTVTITDGTDTVTTTATVDADGNWVTETTDVSALAEGEVTVKAEVADKAGNTSSDEDKSNIVRLVIKVPEDNDANVSEEGLPGGIADDSSVTGGAADPTLDTTNSVTASGSMEILNAGNVFFTQPTLSQIGNTTIGSWDGVGTDTLVAKDADGDAIFTANIATDGSYTVTLNQAVDHPDTTMEDVVSIELPVTATATVGNTSKTGTITVNIEDDMPANDNASLNAVVTPDATNLMVVLDLSESMTTVEAGQTQTRLELAKEVINNLIDTYGSYGDVKVNVVTFSDTATSSGWISLAEAKSLIDNSSVDAGWTNYDAALAEVMSSYNTTGKIDGGQSVSYFLSDGAPSISDGTEGVLNNSSDGGVNGNDVGIDPAERTTWTEFVTANNIESLAIGFGEAQEAELSAVAYSAKNSNPEDDINADDAIVNPDTTQLNQILQNNIIVPPQNGAFVSNGIKFGSGVTFGSDGAAVTELVLEGKNYSYSLADNQITLDDGSIVDGYEFNITTNAGSVLAVNMADGSFTYTAAAPIAASGGTEELTIGYTIGDGDGDVRTSTSTFTFSSGLDHTNLMASRGDDTLTGTEANEIIQGLAGSDNLTGGGGSDIFVWEAGDVGTVANPDVDVVTDFDSATDTLDLGDLLSSATADNIGDYAVLEGDNLFVNTSGGVSNSSYDLQITVTGTHAADVAGMLANNEMII